MLKRIATDILEMAVLIAATAGLLGLVVFGACDVQAADIQEPGPIAVFADGHVRVYPLGPDCFVLLSDGPLSTVLGDLECR